MSHHFKQPQYVAAHICYCVTKCCVAGHQMHPPDVITTTRRRCKQAEAGLDRPRCMCQRSHTLQQQHSMMCSQRSSDELCLVLIESSNAENGVDCDNMSAVDLLHRSHAAGKLQRLCPQLLQCPARGQQYCPDVLCDHSASCRNYRRGWALPLLLEVPGQGRQINSVKKILVRC